MNSKRKSIKLSAIGSVPVICHLVQFIVYLCILFNRCELQDPVACIDIYIYICIIHLYMWVCVCECGGNFGESIGNSLREKKIAEIHMQYKWYITFKGIKWILSGQNVDHTKSKRSLYQFPYLITNGGGEKSQTDDESKCRKQKKRTCQKE